MTVIPIPCLQDNYSYLLVDPRTRQAAVIDPGDGAAARAALVEHGVDLEAVIITHHHVDHLAGVAALHSWRKDVPIYCPHLEMDGIPGATHGLRDGEELPCAGITLQAIQVPGHTLGHMIYLGASALFTGDTLFLGGCGRLFEGTAEQMFDSLYRRILPLPPDLRVYPGHEYTVRTRSFCLSIDPGNAILQDLLEQSKTLRNKGLPTVPGLLGTESKSNVFLRCRDEAVIRAVQAMYPETPPDPLAVFRRLRLMMDSY